MGFMDILEEARNASKETIKEVNVVIQENNEVKTDDNVMLLGDAIMKTSAAALKNKRLSGINSSKRLARAIASGNIKSSQLKKAINVQYRFPKPANPNFKLVGGKPMKALFYLLKSGMDLNDALNTEYKDY